MFIYIIIFIFGLIVGSFLNSIIYRLRIGKSFLRGRSYCVHCRHKLKSLDLIPVFSFLFLGGHCRYCKERISWQYPLVEAATGLSFLLLFVFLFPANGASLNELSIYNVVNVAYYWLISCFLIIIFVYDLKHYIIPNGVIYPTIFIVFLFRFLYLKSSILNPILSAIIASLFFAIIFLMSKGKWIGFGDVKLAFLMGLFLGFPNIFLALFLAFLFGAIIGIILILSHKKRLRSKIPFGPFLVTGTFLALLFGEEIINWYIGLFI